MIIQVRDIKTDSIIYMEYCKTILQANKMFERYKKKYKACIIEECTPSTTYSKSYVVLAMYTYR